MLLSASLRPALVCLFCLVAYSTAQAPAWLVRNRIQGPNSNNYQPGQVEYYTNGLFQETPGLKPLPREARGPYYAGTYFYKGYPIFFPIANPLFAEMSQQAMKDYGRFYISASLYNDPQHIKYLEVNSGGKVREVRTRSVQIYFGKADYYSKASDALGRKLSLGPKFDPPQRPNGFRGFFRGYRPPTWSDVRYKAEIVDADTPLGEIWKKINTKGQLLVKNDEEAFTAFALDGKGRLLSHII